MMKNVSEPYRKPNRNGWYLRWSEHGKRKTKNFTKKNIAQLYRAKKIIELNSDVYDAVDKPWLDLKVEYLKKYDLQNLRASSKYEAEKVMNLIETNYGYLSSRQFTQYLIDQMIEQRISEVNSAFSVNSFIQRIKTLINWMVEKNYHPGKIRFVMQKTIKAPKKALKTPTIRKLLKSAQTSAWQHRIVLSLCTGLRRDDLDGSPGKGIPPLMITDIDFKVGAIDTQSRKTGKSMADRPLPDAYMPHLKKYVRSLPKDQKVLFADTNIRKAWDGLRDRAKMYIKDENEKKQYTVTRQGFRVTYNTLLKRIGIETTAIRLMEHSSARVNKNFYTDDELLDKLRVNRLPVNDWIKGIL